MSGNDELKLMQLVDRHGFKAVVEKIGELYNSTDRRVETTWFLSSESGAWVDEEILEQQQHQQGNFSYDEY